LIQNQKKERTLVKRKTTKLGLTIRDDCHTFHILAIPLIVLFVFVTAASARAADSRTFLLSLDDLNAAKQAWQAGNQSLIPAMDDLLKEANRALNRGPYSVIRKDKVPPSGDKHDYMDLDPFYSPNPDTPDGLPWVRSGRFNSGNLIDDKELEKLSRDVQALTLAYFFTDDEGYAKHAAFLLRHWFIDPATAMNPNANHGRIKPGISDTGFPVERMTLTGRSKFVQLIEMAGILERSPAWSTANKRALQQWSSDFLQWMETSKPGIKERQFKNNHGTTYDLLAALLSSYVEDNARTRGHVRRFRDRIAVQIAPDGSQPEEMRRTNNYRYHFFNLKGALYIATLADRVGVDVRYHETADGRSLSKALEFLMPYASSEEDWPFYPKGVQPIKKAMIFGVYRRAASGYGDPAYEDVAQSVGGDHAADIHNLSFPILSGTGKIGNFAWEDVNGNGIQDAVERGLAGVTVNLRDCSGNLQATTTTDGRGKYLFANLSVGSYMIEFKAPRGFFFSPDKQGTNRGRDSDPDPATGLTRCVSISGGQIRMGLDAGLVGQTTAPRGEIGNLVWEDLDGDGIQEANEPGFPAVKVKLLNCSSNTVIATNTTDRKGKFLFENLAVGSYQLHFIAPSGYVFSPPKIPAASGGGGGRDSDPNPATGLTNCLPLADGQSRMGIDAGLNDQAGPTGQIGDYVWNDADSDGIQDNGEPGIVGVKIKLRTCDGSFVDSTTSDADGFYLFVGLTAGSYAVEFVPPNGAKFSPSRQGLLRGKDSDPDPATGITDCRSLAKGESRRGIDAGVLILR
jgi:hypothetical protein